MAEGDTFLNALIGAAVSVILSFLPFSPVLGGLVAGYLEGGSREDGLRVGAISGVVALIPVAGVLLLVAGVGSFLLLGGIPPRAGAAGAVFLLLVGLLAALYTVGLSALGGWLGNYVKQDTDVGR